MDDLQTSPASAIHLRDAFANVGALVAGRRLFDVAQGWVAATGWVPVFVVTHSIPDGWPRDDAPFTFVTEGVEKAIAQVGAVAGNKIGAVVSANMAQQCLSAGPLDEIVVDLVPVLLGEDVSFFDNLGGGPIELEGRQVIEGTGVTHLSYRVKPR